jgi:hypothetical protein
MTKSPFEALAHLLLPCPRPGGFLSDRERRTITGVAEVLLDREPSKTTPEAAIENLETFLVRGRSRRALRIRVMLGALEMLPLTLGHRPFSRLPLAIRRDIVRGPLATGGHLWRVCSKVRQLIYLGAYADEPAQTAVGFVQVRLRARYRAPHGVFASATAEGSQ